MRSSPFESIVHELSARLEIEDALMRYCKGVDRCDWALMVSAFHPDAIDHHGEQTVPISELIPAAVARHAGILSSCHLIGNVNIRFASIEEALVESYGLVSQVMEPTESDSPGVAATRQGQLVRYIDQFRLIQNEWRIGERQVVQVDRWQAALGRDEAQSVPARRRWPDDPLYLLASKLGLSS